MTRARAVVAHGHDERRRLAYEALSARVRAREPVVLLGHGRAALDELVHDLTREHGATFGLHRRTLLGWAAELALGALAERGATPATPLALAAVARLVARDDAAELPDSALAPVLGLPGLPEVLAATLEELEGARVDPDAALPSADLTRLWLRYRARKRDAGLVGRAELFALAEARAPLHPLAREALVVLDVRLASEAERAFVAALTGLSREALVVAPIGDPGIAGALARADLSPEVRAEDGPLAAARAALFSSAETLAPQPERVTVRSAPGEALEAVEAARFVLEQATRGVPFDEMAVVVRQRELYAAHLATAFARAGVPAHFEVGTRRPHPAGRALLALIACKLERGSGRRLLEYLSTHQLTRAEVARAEADPTRTLPEELAELAPPSEPRAAPPEEAAARGPSLPSGPWARLLGEAGLARAGSGASIAGYVAERVGAVRARWEQEESATPDPARARRLAALDDLSHALAPVLGALDALPLRGPWAQLLFALEALATRALRRPELLLATLGELAPLRAETGEVELAELLALIEPRLRDIEERPAERAYGRVLVTTPDGLRGRARRVVLVPGLAERVFPQPVSEDPLLSDRARESLAPGLARAPERAERERLGLRLALGAAGEQIYASYPRLELEAGRPRVPSIYALEVARGNLGRLPAADELDRLARPPSRVSVLWPAPVEPELAVDESDYALATIRKLLALGPAEARGRARFLVERHLHLRRALITRFRRFNRAEYGEDDGLLWPRAVARDRLAPYSLRARAYSPSALEAYAACPYRFYLRGLLGLRVTEQPEPLDRFDPRTYGDVIHACHARLTRRLETAQLPLGDPARRAEVAALAREVVREVGVELAAARPPLIPQVFQDEMARALRDMLGYLEDVEQRRDGYQPRWADLAFGLAPRAGRDPVSVDEPLVLAGGYLLRGAIDAVEHGRERRLRVTDFKTGRRDPDAEKGQLVIGAGEVLQPLLYAMAASHIAARERAGEVVEARLYFATQRGRYYERSVPVAEDTLARAKDVLAAIDDAITDGLLLASPRAEACEACAYRALCGPAEEARTARKRPATAAQKAHLARLAEIRRQP